MEGSIRRVHLGMLLWSPLSLDPQLWKLPPYSQTPGRIFKVDPKQGCKKKTKQDLLSRSSQGSGLRRSPTPKCRARGLGLLAANSPDPHGRVRVEGFVVRISV